MRLGRNSRAVRPQEAVRRRGTSIAVFSFPLTLPSDEGGQAAADCWPVRPPRIHWKPPHGRHFSSLFVLGENLECSARAVFRRTAFFRRKILSANDL
jgi:hypothetical protein